MSVSEKVKEYSSMIPDEIKRAIRGLNHEVRLAIVAYLVKKKEASFTEIVKELEIDNSLFVKHVKQLILGGLVENFIKSGEVREKYSYYRITPYGYSFLEHLFKSLEPPKVLTIWFPVNPDYMVEFQNEFDLSTISTSQGVVERWKI